MLYDLLKVHFLINNIILRRIDQDFPTYIEWMNPLYFRLKSNECLWAPKIYLLMPSLYQHKFIYLCTSTIFFHVNYYRNDISSHTWITQAINSET